MYRDNADFNNNNNNNNNNKIDLQELKSALIKSLEDSFNKPGVSFIILAGDLNQLPSSFILSSGLIEVFDGPTHEGHNLDRIFASEPAYSYVRAVNSAVLTKPTVKP